ncbi:HPF/RaiA family ribosome-associated protein [Formosa sp. A9]|uniref:HPF/RaiA family ribosome-associated protein n=1 Tax=Formosa sp. A9 TaxID=3442641 RepID=UPI003EB8B55A
MDIRYEYVNITRNNYFEYLIEEHLNPLSIKYPFITGADVFFKVENRSDELENICEIRISAPGPRLFAATNEASIEQAITKSANNIETQLEKRKAQMRTF